MSNVTNRFVLRFNSNISGRIVQLTIPRADVNMSAADAQDAMDAIIANGAVLLTKQGKPASVKDVTLVTTERTTVA